MRYCCNRSCEITLPLGFSCQEPSSNGMYIKDFLFGNTTPHWNGKRVSNNLRRSSLRHRNNSLLLSCFSGNSPGKRGTCLWLGTSSVYGTPEVGLLRIRTLFPDVAVIPAHLGPIPLAMLMGDFNRRPHFLHFGCLSMVTS